jgi:hypothetical protein
VALDEKGRSSFQLLQSFDRERSGHRPMEAAPNVFDTPHGPEHPAQMHPSSRFKALSSACGASRGLFSPTNDETSFHTASRLTLSEGGGLNRS